MRKNLKEARQKAGMTQQQMADRLNISHSYYQKIEGGERLGAIDVWGALEDITGVDQRALREISATHPCKKDNPKKHQINHQF